MLQVSDRLHREAAEAKTETRKEEASWTYLRSPESCRHELSLCEYESLLNPGALPCLHVQTTHTQTHTHNTHSRSETVRGCVRWVWNMRDRSFLSLAVSWVQTGLLMDR